MQRIAVAHHSGTCWVCIVASVIVVWLLLFFVIVEKHLFASSVCICVGDFGSCLQKFVTAYVCMYVCLHACTRAERTNHTYRL